MAASVGVRFGVSHMSSAGPQALRKPACPCRRFVISDTPQTSEKPVVVVLTHGEEEEVKGWGDPDPEEAEERPGWTGGGWDEDPLEPKKQREKWQNDGWGTNDGPAIFAAPLVSSRGGGCAGVWAACLLEANQELIA